MAVRNENGQYAVAPVSKSQLGEQSGDQMPGRHDLDYMLPFGLATVFGTALFGNGGWSDNPMGFPGYTQLYTGSYRTYRWMLQHPILRLVRSIDSGVIAASTWEYEKDSPDVPDRDLEMIKSMFKPLRDPLISDFMERGRDYGWVSGEPIWEYRADAGVYWLKRVKPLLNDMTDVLKDKYGNPTGLVNYVRVDDQAETRMALPYKAWLYTYDAEAGYVYGRSWLENVRETAWKDWLDCAQQLQRLGFKISGVSSIVKSPAGTFPGPIDPVTGKPTEVSFRDNAMDLIKGLAQGAAGAWVPSIGIQPDARGNLDAIKVMAQLIGKSLTEVQVLDFGSQAPAIQGILERMKHAEELMFAGGLRSSRTGLEGKHGTKEEAGVHTDTGTLNAEKDDRNFAFQCQPLIDAALLLSRGVNAVGKIRIKTPSLVDRVTAVFRAILLAFCNDPILVREIAMITDMDKLMSTLGMSLKGQFNPASVQKEVEADRAQASQKTASAAKSPEPQGGRPSNA